MLHERRPTQQNLQCALAGPQTLAGGITRRSPPRWESSRETSATRDDAPPVRGVGRAGNWLVGRRRTGAPGSKPRNSDPFSRLRQENGASAGTADSPVVVQPLSLLNNQ